MLSHNIQKKKINEETVKRIGEKNRNQETRGFRYDMQEHAWGTNLENKTLGYLTQKGTRLMQMKKIYGLDFPDMDNDAKKAEIESAVGNGYVEFDCAYTYKVPVLKDLSDEIKRKIRVIYKYKAGDVDAAINDLNTNYEGIKIETIMLHEIPDRDLEGCLGKLAELCKKYGANAGISNVPVLLLDYIISELAKYEVTLNRIENRVNLLNQDMDVRMYAAEKKIEYMGFGLYGAVTSMGTCGRTQQELMNEEYDLQNDPLLLLIANDTGKTVRHLILGWAEHKQISVISRSKTEKHQQDNFGEHTLSDFEKSILDTFKDRSHINYYYESYFNPQALCVLDRVWGQQARELYYIQVMCTKGYLQVQQAFTQILIDIEWFLNENIKFDVTGITSNIGNLMNLKTEQNIDLSFCPVGKEIDKNLFEHQKYYIVDSDYEVVEWSDSLDEQEYQVYDRVSQRAFAAKYQNAVFKFENWIFPDSVNP